MDWRGESERSSRLGRRRMDESKSAKVKTIGIGKIRLRVEILAFEDRSFKVKKRVKPSQQRKVVWGL